MPHHRLTAFICLAAGLLGAGCRSMSPGERAVIAFRAGQSAYENKRYEEARERFAAAIRLDRGKADAWFKRGNCNYRLGRFEAAVSDYRRALSLSPQSRDALLNLGNVLAWKLDRFREAVLTFHRVLALDPADRQANLQVGFLLHFYFVGGEPQAMRYYHRYLSGGGDDPRVKQWFAKLRSRYPPGSEPLNDQSNSNRGGLRPSRTPLKPSRKGTPR